MDIGVSGTGADERMGPFSGINEAEAPVSIMTLDLWPLIKNLATISLDLEPMHVI